MIQENNSPHVLALHLINVEVPMDTRTIILGERKFVETKLPPNILAAIDRFFTQDLERSFVALQEIEDGLPYYVKNDKTRQMLLEDLRRLFTSFMKMKAGTGAYDNTT